MTTKKLYTQPLIETVSFFHSSAICVGSDGAFQIGGEDIQEDAR